jgi:hypothetical protein
MTATVCVTFSTQWADGAAPHTGRRGRGQSVPASSSAPVSGRARIS